MSDSDGRDSVVDLDEFRCTHWFETLNQHIQLVGPERAVRLSMPGIFPRSSANRVLNADVESALGRLTRFEAWHEAWRPIAEEYEQQGVAALDQDARATARHLLVRATYLYFYTQLYLDGGPLKSELSTRMVDCYRRAAPLLDPPAERVIIPHRGESVFGYFRTPTLGARRPCLIMCGGADTVKEELHYWSEFLLERGVATLIIDGPGQGETHARLPMSASYEGAVSAAVDWLAQRPEIDPARVGMFGISFGGYMAARSLANEPRLRAGVSLGGFYDARDFPQWPPVVRDLVQRLYWIGSRSETIQYVRENVTLAGVMNRVDRPFLIVHGALDYLIGLDEIRQMASETPRGEFWVYPDGKHALWNRIDLVAPRTADWVAQQLDAGN